MMTPWIDCGNARVRVADAGSRMVVFAAAEGERIELASGHGIVATRNTSDALELSGTIYTVSSNHRRGYERC
jgi:hypothetical protein